MPGNRNSGVLALGGIAVAALLAIVGHLGVDGLDPVSLTVSDYAVSDSGGIIHVAMLLLAAASAVLIPALRQLGHRGRVAEGMLAVWAGGLLVSGLVPTNPPGTEMGTAAYVHRYASVVAFVALPIAGWLLAARLPTDARVRLGLRALTLASLLLAAAMVWSAYPGDRAFYGLIERALILTEVALLTLIAAYSSSWSISWRAASLMEPERLG
ncbi:Protein of unknown function [Micromonospora phaseoli]|uniref:DUF998 domain-containing protein n=1 Tax=Micromonospora phaseoli TaxID=1144548 RepID=A0A1H6ZNY2_9ACTN|nr:DUF998 domain-containing protein [Micromonospora phaseoli]PZV97092.1 uncharacterized protein DUF998 [Micromonospora phaseoli]GIJ77328.1 hypothetical protein Xph01_17600 [Micromonospora phaseoli]SEJ55129.1 Protein of unknown function [Micromonospora phaseoli]